MGSRWTAAARRVLLAAACVSLAACAPMQRKALDAQDKGRIRDVDLQVVVPQETFLISAASPNFSGALGGGLIPALIDSSVQKTRQDGMRGEIEALLDPLIDLDFRAEAQSVLKDLAVRFPLQLASTQVIARVPPKAEADARIAATRGGNAYLRMLVQYALDSKSLTLTTRAQAALWQDGKTEPTYVGRLVTQGRARTGVATVDALREQIRAAMADTVRMLAADIASPVAAGNGPKSTRSFLHNGQTVSLQGESVPLTGAAPALRASGGTMFSIRMAEGSK